MALLYVGDVMPKSIDALIMRLYVNGSVVAFAIAVSAELAELGLKMNTRPKKPIKTRPMTSV